MAFHRTIKAFCDKAFAAFLLSVACGMTFCVIFAICQAAKT